MKILIVSDAWKPQTNGVVRTYEYLEAELLKSGHSVRIIGPRDFPWRVPMPGYHEIELVLAPARRLKALIENFAPDTIHIGTEGPLGQTAWNYCRRRGLPFTTCYHTQFPDYAAKRVARVARWLEKPTRNYFIRRLRRFHNASSALMVATPSLEISLKEWGFTVPMSRLTRGVDTSLFTAQIAAIPAQTKRPVAIYVGRVAIEKNLEAFLSMDWPGGKLVVGEGPDLAMLKARYPDAIFAGKKTGIELAAQYQSADIFVFPSRTDTFGMVVVEALSCGLPVAAYPVTGPLDIITEPMLGALNNDLSQAAQAAVNSPGTRQMRHAYVEAHYTWPAVAAQFLEITQRSGALIGRD